MIDFSTSASGGTGGFSIGNFGAGIDFVGLIGKGLDFIVALLVLVFLLILIWSLFEWFNAVGQPEYVLNAKRKATNAVLAIAIVFMSDILADFLILNISGIFINN